MSEAENTQSGARQRSDSARTASLIRSAMTLAKRGKYDAALAKANEAVKLAPRDPRGIVAIADIYQRQNRITMAVEALKKAVTLDSKDTTSQERLLKMMLELGRYDDVVDTSMEYLKKAPRNIFLRDIMGIALLQIGKLDKALRIADELIRLAPVDATHHFKKAVILQQRGDIAKAMASFNRAIELDDTGEITDDARDAIAALDGYQLRQILTIAVEDALFRAKLNINPEQTLLERGFMLSFGGMSILKQMDIMSLPGDPEYRSYN